MSTDSLDGYHMVLEFADEGTLRKYLAQRFTDLLWNDKCKLGLDIANGLKYLHALDIVHKDLVWFVYIVLYAANHRKCCVLIFILMFHVFACSLLLTFLCKVAWQR
jgi:serine/threonine protein kinase